MRTTQRKGDIAVAQAIARFTRMGYDVALPMTESASYDLIVDTDEGLKRVQVRYSGVKEVALRRIHSNSQGYVVKKTKDNAYDWLYVFKNTGVEYLIRQCLVGRTTITPTAEYLISEQSHSRPKPTLHENGFNKTKIVVNTLGDIPMSRSQARVALLNLEKFSFIIFDFDKVSMVGQAFADEIFRVFHQKYPTIKLEAINMNDAVKFMVDRVEGRNLRKNSEIFN